MLMAGTHLLKCWSKAQHAISLSSAEAELYAAVRGAAELLWAKSLLQDMGSIGEKKASLRVDASAAISMMTREGLGSVDTQLLWIQEAVQQKKFNVVKVSTHHNPADMLTKQLTERKVVECCKCPFLET